MEDQSPTEGGTPRAADVTSSAMGDLTSAVSSLDGIVGGIRSEAVADLDDASAALAGVVNHIAGAAINQVDDADAPVVKYLSKVRETAAADHQAALNLLYSVGARPLYVTSEMVADMDRGDLDTSVFEQVIGPMAGVGPDAQVVPHDAGVCPPGFTFDGQISGCVKVADTDLPPPPVVTYSPPPAPGSACDSACPAPVIHVHVPAQQPVPWCRPLPAELPPWWDEAPPEEPPVEPTEPTEPEYVPEEEEEPGPTSPPAPPAEPPAAAPPKPPTAPPPTQFRPATVQKVPVALRPASEWNKPERCDTLSRRDPSRLEFTPEQIGAAFAQQYADAQLADAEETDRLRVELAAQGKTLDKPITRRKEAVDARLNYTVDWLNQQSGDGGMADRGAVAAILAQQQLDARVGGPWDYLATGFKYDLQYSSPQFLPSQEEVDRLYYAGVISPDLWGCLTKANGNHLWARDLVLQANRNKPTLGEYISLYRRGMISLPNLREFAKGHGVNRDDDLDAMVKASEFIPPYTDVVRMMVRDAADPAAVDAGKYDTDFEQKYAGPLRGWAQAQGISDEVMRYIWRSHWTLPSPTAMYEMLRRLRPGRVPDELAVTPELVKRTLQQNDMAPGFIDQMVAISYNTLTRTDLLAFFTSGSMDKAEVVERLQDAGYSLADSQRIANSWELEAANRRANRSRVWSRTNIVKHYKMGSIPRDQADKLLSRTIPSADERAAVLDDVDVMRKAEATAKCIKGIYKRYKSGELDDGNARLALQELGLDLRQRSDIVDAWKCEKAASAKTPTLAMLREWYLDGLIGLEEFIRRLGELGYTPLDSQRIVLDGIQDERERRAKQAEAARRRAEADDAKRAAAAARVRKQREREAAGGGGGGG